MSDLLKITPLKDMKPQLLCVGKLLGMDLYIDVLGQSEDKYELAQKFLQKAFDPPKEEL